MTLAPLLAVARADLAEVTRRLPEFWEHMWATDWQPETVSRSRTPASRPPIPDFGQLPVREAYLDVLHELAQAHEILGKRTDVPVHWMLKPSALVVSERAPLVEHSEVRDWCEILAGMLDWLGDRNLDAAGQRAVEEACGHIGAARGHIEDLWPPHRRQPQKLPLCLHCGKEPPERQRSDTEATRKWCSGCRRGHQPDRLSCQVCGLGAA